MGDNQVTQSSKLYIKRRNLNSFSCFFQAQQRIFSTSALFSPQSCWKLCLADEQGLTFIVHIKYIPVYGDFRHRWVVLALKK